MGMRGDFNDLKEAWSSFSLLTKIFLAGSFLTSSLSLASIADSVFKLRGFIEMAIAFYHSLVEPLTALIAEYIGLDLVQGQVDGIILVTIITTSFIRVNRILGVTKETFFWVCLWVAWVGLIIIIDDGSGFPSIFMSGFYMTMIFLVGLLSAVNPIWIGMFLPQFSPRDVVVFRLTAINILAVLIFVAVVASISEGLTRV